MTPAEWSRFVISLGYFCAACYAGWILYRHHSGFAARVILISQIVASLLWVGFNAWVEFANPQLGVGTLLIQRLIHLGVIFTFFLTAYAISLLLRVPR